MRPLLVAIAILSLSVVPARAQVISEPAPPPFPDPKKFARGFFAQGELGALVYLGNLGKYASAGPTFGARLGYDVLRWLAVQAHVSGTSSSATVPPPTTGQALQMYLYAAEVQAQVQLRRFALLFNAGAGAAQLSTNVLAQVGIGRDSLFSLAVKGGLGLDYHTLNRHFSVGVRADYLYLQGFENGHALSPTVYLKYTH